tara:strand:- start:13705 stop:14529 length:825 start_codon:yes stop_codon:yes gene_type:complete
MNNIFINKNHQKQYDNNGFVIIEKTNFLDVNYVSNFYNNLPKVNDDGFYASLYSKDPKYKLDINNFLLNIYQNIIDTIFHDYKIITANFVTKTIGENSIMPPHQDWSFVDEKKYTSFNIWIPLSNVTHENGCLYLLKSCQKLPFTIRGTGVRIDFHEILSLNFNNMECIPIKSGQIVIYDHRTIHASPANNSNKKRIAIASAIIPKKAKTIHYYNNEKYNRLEKYRVNPKFFLEYTFGDTELPKSVELIDYIENFSNPIYNQDSLKCFYSKKDN